MRVSQSPAPTHTEIIAGSLAPLPGREKLALFARMLFPDPTFMRSRCRPRPRLLDILLDLAATVTR